MGFLQEEPQVQVIVPARNEQECVGACLESLVNQQGIAFQITVVDDGSTDSTHAIAESFSGVRVISAEEPAPGVTGKCNALISAARNEQAKWLLFTDADTVHYPGSLAGAVAEAGERGVDLLSYSPEQETGIWSEHILLPVVFAELARAYPPARVNNPADPTVAANGQYILVRRSVYETLGGHRRVADKVLEDVELARIFKSAGHKIWFRMGTGKVRTRMYRNFGSMIEGWTKNLALLFRHPLRLALVRELEFILIFGLAVAGVMIFPQWHSAALLMWTLSGLFYLNFLARIRAAHFPWKANVAAIFGLPLFSWVLARSYLHSRVLGKVMWKGRLYTDSEPSEIVDSSIQEGNLTLKG